MTRRTPLALLAALLFLFAACDDDPAPGKTDIGTVDVIGDNASDGETTVPDTLADAADTAQPPDIAPDTAQELPPQDVAPDVDTGPPAPGLAVSPDPVNFGVPAGGELVSVNVTLSNIGDADITMLGGFIIGASYFDVGAGFGTRDAIAMPSEPIAPGGTHTLVLTYQPNTPVLNSGQLFMGYHYKGYEFTHEMDLIGNGEPPETQEMCNSYCAMEDCITHCTCDGEPCMCSCPCREAECFATCTAWAGALFDQGDACKTALQGWTACMAGASCADVRVFVESFPDSIEAGTPCATEHGAVTSACTGFDLIDAYSFPTTNPDTVCLDHTRSVFSGEIRDELWAPTPEAMIQDALDNPTQAPSQPLVATYECHRTLCQLLVEGPRSDLDHFFYVELDISITNGLSGQMLHHNADDTHSEAYLARSGHNDPAMFCP